MTKKVYKNMVPGGAYKPVGGEWDHPIDLSFRGSKASRGIFSSSKFYLVVVFFCHVEDSSTPLALRSE